MTLFETLNSIFDVEDWDCPFYKRLPKNDTGEAIGHQAGFLLPKKFRQYFPDLPSGQETVGVRIQADLYDGPIFLQRVSSRYQYQTWGGTRAPETRITDRLRPLLDKAVKGDFLVMRRHLDQPQRYCFQLIREVHSGYSELERIAEEGSDDGILGGPGSRVLATSEVGDEEDKLRRAAENDQTFAPFEERDQRGVTTRKPVRRAAFAQLIIREYGRQCCVCGSGLVSPAGPVLVEAAHIIPVSAGGVDDPRNGLGLCRNHHWAFDNGLFTIEEDMRVKVSEVAEEIPENYELKELAGRMIRHPQSENLKPHPEALQWHESHVFVG